MREGFPTLMADSPSVQPSRRARIDTSSVQAQVAALANRYSDRAEAYDRLWSPAIQRLGTQLLRQLPLESARHVVDVGTGAGALLPVISRAAPRARVVGVDNSEGMLRLARGRHAGPLALMSAEQLQLPDHEFDVVVIAFVLFHLARPERCLAEAHRVLRRGGAVGTTTWGRERFPSADEIWNDELTKAGAPMFSLPAVDNRSCCDTESKMVALLHGAGFTSIRTWSERLVHRWRREDHFEHQRLVTARYRLEALVAEARDTCLQRTGERLEALPDDAFVFDGDVILSTAIKP